MSVPDVQTVAELRTENPLDASDLLGTYQIVLTSAANVSGVALLSEFLDWLTSDTGGELETTANKNQPDGYAGLNADGDLVGPLILSVYANAAAAGVLDDGELGVVAGKLHLGDNATTGGNRVGGARPSYHDITATGSVTVDAYASHTFFSVVMVNDAITITISNLADIPNGHVIYLYVENTGSANQITINGGVLDTFVIGDALSVLTLVKRSSGWTIWQETSV